MAYDVTVIDHDNRGTEDYPYGFIYFDDQRRVAYAWSLGIQPESTGGWGSVGPTHITRATEYARARHLIAED